VSTQHTAVHAEASNLCNSFGVFLTFASIPQAAVRQLAWRGAGVLRRRSGLPLPVQRLGVDGSQEGRTPEGPAPRAEARRGRRGVGRTPRTRSGDLRYTVEFTERARRQLVALARRHPDQTGSVAARVRWLGENAGAIQHEKMQASPECSLHVGAYGVLYQIDHAEGAIVVADLDLHDAAYRKLRKRR